MKLYENKIKKISGISAIAALIISVIFETARRYFPKITERPTSTEYTLSLWRNFFLIILAVAFTVFIFLLFKGKLGLCKAIFYTLYSNSFIGFLTGAVIMSVASMNNVAAFGITAIESLYYYFLGIFIMVICCSAFVVGVISHSILKLILKLKKKNKNTST